MSFENFTSKRSGEKHRKGSRQSADDLLRHINILIAALTVLCSAGTISAHFNRCLYCRSIVVRRCVSIDVTVWSQELQACVDSGSSGPQVQPPQNRSTVSGGNHRHPHTYPHHLILGHKHRGSAAPAAAGSINPCRPGGPPFYRPHPTSKSKYIQCSATGRAFVMRCPGGLRWNQRATTCDRSTPGYMYRHTLS